MKIAIQAADLDSDRIDGTRVYILNLLKYFGKLDEASQFLVYHRNNFNPELTPPKFSNYKIIQKSFPFLWTQTRFASALWRDKPDVLWMPMMALPVIRRKKTKTVITVHDLAFKFFPEHFPKNDLRRLNLYCDYAIKNSAKIIAVSNSTKRDILRCYPSVLESKIKVIYHGFDRDIYEKERDISAENDLCKKLGISKKYILYTGALQPRKNLIRLINAFNEIKKEGLGIQLVLAGGKAWMYEEIFKQIEKSPNKKDIINTGKLDFEDLGNLLRGASVFVYPSLYEGFGIPVLEAFAAKVPVILAKNSSLTEVGGDGALYFKTENVADLSCQIKKILSNEELAKSKIQAGYEHLKNFSWEKCARETLEYLES
jgi:glycosyltransferase involved in cell wall biosynthesis